MTDQPIETTLGEALWRQFGAALDMLDRTLRACPAALWTERLWSAPPPDYFPPQFGEFWYVVFHALVWTDLYLAGVPEEEFAPPAPFPAGEIDSAEVLPAQPYTPDRLRAYLTSLRGKVRAAFLDLSDAQARRPVEYGWTRGQTVSYLELQLYNLRHVQEHAAQLSLFLGQHGVPGDALGWVARARDEGDARPVG